MRQGAHCILRMGLDIPWNIRTMPVVVHPIALVWLWVEYLDVLKCKAWSALWLNSIRTKVAERLV